MYANFLLEDTSSNDLDVVEVFSGVGDAKPASTSCVYDA